MAKSKASALLDGEDDDLPKKAPPQDPALWDRREEDEKRAKIGAPPLTDAEWNELRADGDGVVPEDEPEDETAADKAKARKASAATKAAADRAEAAHEAKRKGSDTKPLVDALKDATAATKRRRGRREDVEPARQVKAGDNTVGIAGGQILAFVERIERLDEEARTVAEDRKEVLSEAKGNGFDTKIIKRIVATRKKDKDAMDEEDSLFDLYMQAIEAAEREDRD